MHQTWTPIVVDIPTVSFEPRPPLMRYFRPDTICDGWSTKEIVVRLAAVRGYSHRYAGVPRQDAAEVRLHPSGVVVFAVADGVSSAPRADDGAHIACDAMVTTLLDALDRRPDSIDWPRALRVAADQMIEWCGPDRGRIEREYATTLVAGVAFAGRGGQLRSTIVQIGDSSAWILHNRQFRAVLHHKNAHGESVFSSEVIPFPHVPQRVTPVNVEVPAGAVLLIGTDGFGDPLGDGTGLVGDLFAEVLREPPPPLRLAHTLDFSRETFDDDRALIALWPGPGR